MIHRIFVNGVITLYSEETCNAIVELIEEDELFDYINVLLNTGFELDKIAEKLQKTRTEVGTVDNTSPPSDSISNPVSDTKSVQRETNKSEEEIKRVSAPVKGSAANALAKMRRVNKKS